MRVAELRLVGLLMLGAALPGCENIASLDCAGIGDKAKEISRDQPLRIRAFANVRETLRNEAEIRCAGDATFADGGTAPLHFRARVEAGEIAVAYQGIPFE